MGAEEEGLSFGIKYILGGEGRKRERGSEKE